MPPVDVLCPTARKWDPEQCFSFTHLCLHAAMAGLLRGIRYRKWIYLDQARNMLADEVLAEPGATHALWLDDDMVCPPDLITRLLAHGVPVVGAVYFTRSPPHEVVCGPLHYGQARALDHLPAGLEPVGWVGLGAALVEVGVMAAMKRRYGDGLLFRSDLMGEDVWFCRRLEEMGVPVHVDGGTVCGHVADQVIGAEHWKHYHTGGEG